MEGMSPACALHVPCMCTACTPPWQAREEEWRRQDQARFAHEEDERQAAKRAQKKELEVISENHRRLDLLRLHLL